MEECATKDQSSISVGRSNSRLLRYPLRSGSRSKEEKPPVADSINSHSATKRGRPESNVAKSMGVIDISGKEKPVKPPRRLSVPSKSNATTPASKSKRPDINQAKSDTPLSEVSKSFIRKKFSTLSSASYWLSQIQLSESAAKHSISLGFFKLAFEAGCEPMKKMRDELKAYARRHDLSGLGEPMKELFESNKIFESYEPSEASRACSEVPTEPNQLSDDDDVNSSLSSVTDTEKLKPKSLDRNADEIQGKKTNIETTKKDDGTVKKTKRSESKNVTITKSGSEVKGSSIQKKPQKHIKKELNNDKVKKQGKKFVAGLLNSPSKEAIQENKENMAAQLVEAATEV